MKNWQGRVITLIALISFGCSSGFQTDSSPINSALGNENNSGLGNELGSTSPSTVWEKALEELTGLVSGGAYDGNLAVEVLPDRQSLALILPLPPIFLAPLNQTPIPQLSGSSLEYRRKPDGSFDMAVIIPIRHLTRGGSLAPYNRLPNGNPVPFMPSGESRGFAIELPQRSSYKLHFYFVANAVGVFIETPNWRLPEELSALPTIGFPVRNLSQTQVNGYFAIVPNRGNFASGLFISTRIPRELAFQLDQILRY